MRIITGLDIMTIGPCTIMYDTETGKHYRGKVAPDREIEMGTGGGSTLEYMVPIWAEENAALGASNTYEWAFGNGANTPSDGGLTVYVPDGWACTVVAISLRVGGGIATVELVHNGVPKGADCRVVLSTGQSATDVMGAPLPLSNNDYINFRTLSSSGTSGPSVVTAWLRFVKS